MKRVVYPLAPTRETRGDFDFPPDPLKTTQRGGAAVPPLWIPLPGPDGGAAAEREANQVGFAPRPRNSRSRATSWKFQQDWGPRPTLTFASTAQCLLLGPPYMSKPAQRAGFGHESAFLFHRCGGDFSLGATQRKVGAATPVPRPRRGTPVPILRHNDANGQKRHRQDEEIRNELPNVFQPAVIGHMSQRQRAHHHRRRGSDDVHEA